MPPDFLTRGNVDFSQAEALRLTIHRAVVENPRASTDGDPSGAASCTSLSVRSVDAYVQSGIAHATRRAYRADLDHFGAGRTSRRPTTWWWRNADVRSPL